jgi:hypothetical protein
VKEVRATKLLLDPEIRSKLAFIAKKQRRDLTTQIYYIIDLFLDYPETQEDILREINILKNYPGITEDTFPPSNTLGGKLFPE